DLDELSLPAPRDAHQAARGLRHEVETAAMPLRPRGAEGRDPAVDEARVDPGELLIAETEPVQGVGTEVLDQDVHAGYDLADELAPSIRAEVDGDALLVPVDDRELLGVVADAERAAPGLLALEPLHLD